jgi:nicotinamidase-related amidase
VIVIEGKTVFTELDELVDPAHTALVLVDMQRDFVEPDGAFAQLGIDVSVYSAMRPRLAGLLHAARASGVLVVHLQNTALPHRRSDSPAQIRFNMRMHAAARRGGPALRYTVAGTTGHDIIPDLAPVSSDLVVGKYRSSGFWGTNLDMLLRSNDICSVVVTGCTTEGCVDSTARDALFCDYYVVVARDCVASDDAAQHEAAMLLLEHRFDLASAADIADVWSFAQIGSAALNNVERVR